MTMLDGEAYNGSRGVADDPDRSKALMSLCQYLTSILLNLTYSRDVKPLSFAWWRREMVGKAKFDMHKHCEAMNSLQSGNILLPCIEDLHDCISVLSSTASDESPNLSKLVDNASLLTQDPMLMKHLSTENLQRFEKGSKDEEVKVSCGGYIVGVTLRPPWKARLNEAILARDQLSLKLKYYKKNFLAYQSEITRLQAQVDQLIAKLQSQKDERRRERKRRSDMAEEIHGYRRRFPTLLAKETKAMPPNESIVGQSTKPVTVGTLRPVGPRISEERRSAHRKSSGRPPSTEWAIKGKNDHSNKTVEEKVSHGKTGRCPPGSLVGSSGTRELYEKVSQLEFARRTERNLMESQALQIRRIANRNRELEQQNMSLKVAGSARVSMLTEPITSPGRLSYDEAASTPGGGFDMTPKHSGFDGRRRFVAAAGLSPFDEGRLSRIIPTRSGDGRQHQRLPVPVTGCPIDDISDDEYDDESEYATDGSVRWNRKLEAYYGPRKCRYYNHQDIQGSLHTVPFGATKCSNDTIPDTSALTDAQGLILSSHDTNVETHSEVENGPLIEEPLTCRSSTSAVSNAISDVRTESSGTISQCSTACHSTEIPKAEHGNSVTTPSIPRLDLAVLNGNSQRAREDNARHIVKLYRTTPGGPDSPLEETGVAKQAATPGGSLSSRSPNPSYNTGSQSTRFYRSESSNIYFQGSPDILANSLCSNDVPSVPPRSHSEWHCNVRDDLRTGELRASTADRQVWNASAERGERDSIEQGAEEREKGTGLLGTFMGWFKGPKEKEKTEVTPIQTSRSFVSRQPCPQWVERQGTCDFPLRRTETRPEGTMGREALSSLETGRLEGCHSARAVALASYAAPERSPEPPYPTYYPQHSTRHLRTANTIRDEQYGCPMRRPGGVERHTTQPSRNPMKSVQPHMTRDEEAYAIALARGRNGHGVHVGRSVTGASRAGRSSHPEAQTSFCDDLCGSECIANDWGRRLHTPTVVVSHPMGEALYDDACLQVLQQRRFESRAYSGSPVFR